jgi:cation:H+ antiporter
MILFGGASAVVLVTGYQLTRSADAIAVETGLGASFVGAVFLAFATSLPELSATIAAVRIRSYELAVANIFGSNALMVALLIEADLFYREGSLLAHATAPVEFSSAMGVTVTVAYLIGIVERRNQTVLHMGLDSLAALVVLVSTLAGLFLMR